MIIGSLFSGIGGLELGVEAALREAGIPVEIGFQVEQDPYCRAVLAKHWPLVNRTITDVRLATAQSLPRVDLLAGGFPCQDVSGAGKGAGLAGARSGLWFEFKRIVGELRPSAVIVENVASGKKRWLCQVRADLHSLGYRTRAVQVSAFDCGAPHRRERVFVLAMADANRRELRDEQGRSGGQGGAGAAESGDAGSELAHADARGRGERPGTIGVEAGCAEPADGGSRLAHAHLARLEGRSEPIPGSADERAPRQSSAARSDDAIEGVAQSRMGREPHGLPRGLDCHRWPAPRGAEQHPWEAPRTVEGKQAHRRQRLKGLGNAVVPHQARAATLVLIEWLRTP